MNQSRGGKAASLSPEQLDLLIATLPAGTHQVLAELLRKTGSRISEARQLKWGNITPLVVKFPKEVTKGKRKGREVDLHPQLEKTLKSWKSEWSLIQKRQPELTDFIFPGRDPDHPITSRAFELQLKTASLKAKLPDVKTHSFRRSALSHASSLGIPLRDIQELSGHSNLATLQKYLDVSPEARRRAAMAFA